jgi:hypothetical protein
VELLWDRYEKLVVAAALLGVYALGGELPAWALAGMVTVLLALLCVRETTLADRPEPIGRRRTPLNRRGQGMSPSALASGSSTNVSTARSGSMWLALQKAITLRSVTCSTPPTRSLRIVF